MKKAIKGLLVDPEKQTITEVDVECDDNGESHVESIYKHLDCSCFDVARRLLTFLPSIPDDDVWLDDEAGFNGGKYMFLLPGFVPLVGRGLILSHDYRTGESLSHTLTAHDIEVLRDKICWMVRETV